MGGGWSLAYFLYIVGSFRHSSYQGVPFGALILNCAWEFSFAHIFYEGQKDYYLTMYNIWLGLDLVILGQFCYYERAKIKQNPLYYCGTAVTLFGFLLAFVLEIHDLSGTYMALLQNAFMSVLFVDEALRQNSGSGTKRIDPWTTIVPGICRWVGSAAASVALIMWIYDSEFKLPLIPFLGVTIFVWDAYYVYLTATQYFFASSKEHDGPRKKPKGA